MLSTWVCSHALGSVCSVFWWGMRLHMHVESLVWSDTAVGFYEVRIVQPGWKLCNWWRWQSIGCCCLSSQNMHSSQPLPIGNKYVVVTDLDVLFFALRSSSSCENACLSLYQQCMFGDLELKMASMSCQHVKLPYDLEVTAVLCRSSMGGCSVCMCIPGLNCEMFIHCMHYWACKGRCLSSGSNLVQIARLVRLCYLTLRQNTLEVSSFSPGQIHEQVPVFLTCVKNLHVWGNQNKKVPFKIDFLLKLQLLPCLSPCMAWRKPQSNCDWNCFSYSNTNSDISILFWYRKSFFSFPAISSQHFSLSLSGKYFVQSQKKISLWAMIPL